MSGELARRATGVALPGPAEVAVPDRLLELSRGHAGDLAGGHDSGRENVRGAGRTAGRGESRLGGLVAAVADQVMSRTAGARHRQQQTEGVSDAEVAAAWAGQDVSEPCVQQEAAEVSGRATAYQPAPALEQQAEAPDALAQAAVPEAIEQNAVPAIEAPAIRLEPGLDYWTTDLDPVYAGLPDLEAG